MSVLAAIAGIMLIFVGVFSPDPPATYAWAAGLPLVLWGVALEHKLARRRYNRRVPPRAIRYRVDSTRGFERGNLVDVDGRRMEVVAVDTLEGDLYLREPVVPERWR